jgi:hypothetical protein
LALQKQFFCGNYYETTIHPTEGTKRYQFAAQTMDAILTAFVSNNVADWWQHWCFRFRSSLELEVDSSD